MRVFLVDFENVKSEGLRCVDCLDEGDQVITFFSRNAESLSMDTYFNLINSNAKFYAVRLDRTGSNALDFQLVAYLGYLMGTPEHQDVYIISKDHGFYSAATFCRNFLIPQSKYHKTVTQFPSIASLFPNYVESRPVGINAIPMFTKAVMSTAVPETEDPVMPTEEKEAEPEKAADIMPQPEKEPESQQPDEAVQDSKPAPVLPKRREVRVSKNTEKESKPAAQKPRSDWDEFSAAAEVGLQVIDMFGKNAGSENDAVQKKVSPSETVKAPLNEEKESWTPDIPKPAEEEVKPEEQVQQQTLKEESAVGETKETLSGAEIDKMLEEFLEEAAAAIEAEMKEMPAVKDMPEFIEVDTAEAKEDDEEQKIKPQEDVKEDVKPERTGRRKNQSRSRKGKADEPKQPETLPKEGQPKEATDKSVADAPAKPNDEASRQLVKKALTGTIEIEDAETQEDLEKLTDCIINAAGKQDLYRMIIKLFGQKTGLEYYKVVKREYTNICNQIGKK